MRSRALLHNVRAVLARASQRRQTREQRPMTTGSKRSVIVVGGGIGGLAVSLALAKKGIAVRLFEQAPEIKEIGAGIQLGPNVFRMFKCLGLTSDVSKLAVFPEHLMMLDSVTGQEVTKIALDE